MTYLSECLADSPDVLYSMDTYASGYADSSGNAWTLSTVSGTIPASTATAPDGTPNAASAWTTASGYLRTTLTRSSPTVGTYECWFRYASAPAANVMLYTWCPNTGSSGGTTYVALLTSGKIEFSVTGGSTVVIDSPSALTTNTWHHIVCSWGAGGMTMRIDKATVGTGAGTSATSLGTSSFRVHGYWSGAANILQTGAYDMAWAAFYPTQLTNARTDAHYNAMLPAASGSASLSLSGSGASAAAGTGTGSLALSASGAAAVVAAGSGSLDLSATGAIGSSRAAGGTGSLSLSAAGDTAGDTAGSGSLTLTGSADATGSEAAAGTGVLSLDADASGHSTGTGTLELVAAGSAAILYTTDTSNALDGLDITFTGTATVTKAPAPVPPTLVLGERYEVAIPYPQPTMVNGRPT